MDKEYWTAYYKKYAAPKLPSSFAMHIIKYLATGNKLIDLACGNGRDSIFFAKNGINCLGVDQVETEIQFLNDYYATDSLEFKVADISNLQNIGYFDYIYSRFSLHSIDKMGEESLLNWVKKNIKLGGYFFLEARSLKDDMFQKGRQISNNENITDHYRRYLDFNTIKAKIKSLGFDLIEAIEAKGLSIYKDDDPVVIRIVAKKLS